MSSLPRPPTHLIGRRFGTLVVESLQHVAKPGRGRWVYRAECHCDCGGRATVLTASLRRSATTSCGCRRDQYLKNAGSKNHQFTGFRGITGHFWHQLKRRAANRGMPVDITMQYAWSLFLRQKRRCALSGVGLAFAPGRASRTTASLDRIDNARGYVRGNVRWVHKTINIMRNALPTEQFVEWCGRVAAHRGRTRIVAGGAPPSFWFSRPKKLVA